MKIVKWFFGGVWKILKEFVVQSSTLLGFIYAWVTYSGMTKLILGWLTLAWIALMFIVALFVKADE
jgi:hypothetical protein